MKLHIVTVGAPKLSFARQGFDEYIKRLGRFHNVRVTHIPDKHANDPTAFEKAAQGTYTIAMCIDAKQFTSTEFADFLNQKSQDGRELSFLIGGPEGLPNSVIQSSHMQLGLSKLTLPHDLAMVFLAEALYRASTIGAGHPYHK